MANTTGKKYGGREKGTPNRLTKELRTILKDVLYNELEKIEELRGIVAYHNEIRKGLYPAKKG